MGDTWNYVTDKKEFDSASLCNCIDTFNGNFSITGYMHEK